MQNKTYYFVLLIFQLIIKYIDCLVRLTKDIFLFFSENISQVMENKISIYLLLIFLKTEDTLLWKHLR